MKTPLETLSRCPGVRGIASCRRVAGVYVLFAGNEAIYVGSSADVLARIGQHRAATDPRASRKEFDSALWLELPVSVMRFYEGALIRALRPRLSQRACVDSSHDAEILYGLGLSDSLDEQRVDWEDVPFVACNYEFHASFVKAASSLPQRLIVRAARAPERSVAC